ncbi:Transmembrane and immunoglobulin domain-containing protein 1-like [Homarus americanus]|uniref:Transmembrane and immunoglobulin domain-containing protein 1-like n=1 Tax=Homarus americanus TaxID=6706 RepID=A0A8J5MJU9_HOMAM|nr:Transmembrane and immunoglobulin domain-containing protein 1-like [Homarus americanus]
MGKVSWVRHRDIHLLTVGAFTYTSDERFSARHAEGSEDWLLMVHYLQERDAGLYECQISTTPPQSHYVHLSVVGGYQIPTDTHYKVIALKDPPTDIYFPNLSTFSYSLYNTQIHSLAIQRFIASVLEPETVITGGPDLYINTGSRLALTCSVKYSPEPPAFIFWYHNDKLVSYERHRGAGVEVSTERGVVSTSRLRVAVVEQRHSGVYTCSPANSQPRKVNVHVIAGDTPAAIVHENNSCVGVVVGPPCHTCYTCILLTCLFLLLLAHLT